MCTGVLTVPFMSRYYRCSHCDDVIDGKIITLDNKFVCGKCSDEVNTAINFANINKSPVRARREHVASAAGLLSGTA